MDGEYFPLVLLPRLDGELVQTDIEELDRAIACSYHNLVLVRFGPRKIVEGVLSVKP